MISTIDKNISHLSTRLTTYNNKNALKLKDKIITEELKMLYNKFTVVLIERTRGTVAFVYRNHCAQVLINVLGLNNVNIITSTCMKAIEPVDKNMSDDTSFLKNKFNHEVNEMNKNSLTKLFSRAVTAVLKLLVYYNCNFHDITIFRGLFL